MGKWIGGIQRQLTGQPVQARAYEVARLVWLIVTVMGIAAFLEVVPQLAGPYIQPTPPVRAALERMGISLGLYATANIGMAVIFIFGHLTVAGMIFIRKSNDWMALFVALFLISFGLSTPLTSLPLAELRPALAVFAGILNAFAWFALNALFYLFPDWQFVPRWTWIALLVLFFLVIFSSLPASVPYSLNNLPGWLTGILLVAGWGTGCYAQIYRYRRVSTTVQRQQTKWVVYGLVMSILLNLLVSLPGLIQPSLLAPGTLYAMITTGPIIGPIQLLIPISLGIAVLRYRLWDIDPIINRTLVYGILTAVIVSIYMLVVSGLGLIFTEYSGWLVSLLATGLVTAVFQPLREHLQRWINHLMYGDRDDPYTVLARLGQQLEMPLTPETVLPSIVETVACSLKLPYAAAHLRGTDGIFHLAASYPPGMEKNQFHGLLRLPLIFQQEEIGELLFARRAPDEEFSSQDRLLLADLAHQVGIAAHAVQLHYDLRRLSEDLQRSREQLVLAREEERRRIRRDLHDGLGPTLAALALSASSIADLVSTNPEAAARLAREMQDEIRSSIGGIRQLVYELRPPSLDELGLLAAIRDRAAQMAHAASGGSTTNDPFFQDNKGLVVEVTASEQLNNLPAAVEVAAYRIVVEALTNVVRHASAHHCLIHLACREGTLEIEVCDDGIGFPDEYHAGMGLLSMRERAAELGGACIVTSDPDEGTQVRVSLPFDIREAKSDGENTSINRG